MVVISENGVIYYAGESSPTVFQESIIEEWMKLPVVSLFYDGPEELKGVVEKALNDSGILIGVGTPLYVFVKTKNDLCAIWMRYESFEYDDFEDPINVEDLGKFLSEKLVEIFGKLKKPQFGFEVTLKDGSLIVNVNKTGVPVVFRRIKSKYRVVTSKGEFLLEEGFHLIDGKLIYVGKDMNLRSEGESFKFIEGIDMIYPDGSMYSNGYLILPSGMKIEVEMPVGVWKDYIVLRNSILVNDKVFKRFESTVIDAFDGFILLSDGSVAGISENWRMKVSCIPLEWAFRCEKLYLLDVCGNLVVFDPKRKKVEEDRYPSAYGFDFLKGELIVGTERGVLSRNGGLDYEDFCVENGKMREFKNVVRTHLGICLVPRGGSYEVHGTNLEGSYFKVFEDFVVLKGEGGIWVVKSKRESTSCW